jgi:hypothetical protein
MLSRNTWWTSLPISKASRETDVASEEKDYESRVLVDEHPWLRKERWMLLKASNTIFVFQILERLPRKKKNSHFFWGILTNSDKIISILGSRRSTVCPNTSTYSLRLLLNCPFSLLSTRWVRMTDGRSSRSPFLLIFLLLPFCNESVIFCISYCSCFYSCVQPFVRKSLSCWEWFLFPLFILVSFSLTCHFRCVSLDPMSYFSFFVWWWCPSFFGGETMDKNILQNILRWIWTLCMIGGTRLQMYSHLTAVSEWPFLLKMVWKNIIFFAHLLPRRSWPGLQWWSCTLLLASDDIKLEYILFTNLFGEETTDRNYKVSAMNREERMWILVLTLFGSEVRKPFHES